VLLHEVYNPIGEEMKEEHWQKYFSSFHTSPEELGRIATEARPKLLVLYHQVLHKRPEQELVDEVKQHYSGKFVSARDLGVY